MARGADLSALAGTDGSPLKGRPFGIPLEWLQYFLLQDPKWDFTTVTPAGFELLWRQSVEQYGAVIGTDDPDLTRFRDHGGKVIIYHGLTDQLIPAEGTGWEMEAYGIVKGTKNLDAAKKIADWAATKAANELYSKTYAVVAMPGVVNYPPNYPADAEKKMIKNDFVWMAENRDKILAEWTKRYESKAAPKN